MDTFIENLFNGQTWLSYGFILGASVALGLLPRWLIFLAMRFYNKKNPSVLTEQLLLHLKKSTKLLLPLVFVYSSFSFLKIDVLWYTLTVSFIIVNFAWLLMGVLKAAEEVVKEKFKINKHHKAKDRRVLTQLRFLKSIATVVIVTLAVASILWNIPAARKLGETILTSAGIIGIIVGVAAQKSIANLVTGFQVAFTQAIKIDDEVVIEGEFGAVEDITLTYVVVKTWDWRRLVLPLNYFNDKPFVNWTFNSKPVIASVFFQVDFTFPVSELRKKLMEVLKEDPLWDKDQAELLVTDIHERVMILRATFSVKNATDAWDLRCKVREELVRFIQTNYPEALPKLRRMDTEEIH